MLTTPAQPVGALPGPRSNPTPTVRANVGPLGRVAFVLQGGGALSAPQVGMLRALLEAGITPDLVVGSSAGAVNAVAFASDPTLEGVANLAASWRNLRRKHVAQFSVRALAAALTGRSSGLMSNAALSTFLSGGLVVPRLEDAKVAAHVVVTDFVTGEPVVLSSGETVTALLASSAFPGLYPPVRSGSRLYVDGGVAADIPILQAESLGATTSFVLPAAGQDDDDTIDASPLSSAYRALGQLLDAITRRDLSAATGTVRMVPAPTSTASNPIDFRDTHRLIDEGYLGASDWLRRLPTRAQARATPRLYSVGGQR